MKSKLIVILGPTSAGKSSLAIKLARKFQGEIISADSRQVYKGMDLGTGKVTRTEQKLIPHHLLDVASPKKQFTVAHFQSLARSTIKKILAKNKLPFLVGGTPFWIYATIDDLQIPEVAPNRKLRSLLRTKSAPELFRMLNRIDPRRAKNIDRHNPVRLIRATEIVKATGAPVPVILSGAKDLKLRSDSSASSQNDMLILGIKQKPEKLRQLIANRLDKRLQQGLIAEVKRLLKQGVTHKRLRELGLEYRFVSLYLQGKLDYAQMKSQLLSAIHKFAKRQMTWFKTDRRIHWTRNQKQAEQLIKNYLKK